VQQWLYLDLLAQKVPLVLALVEAPHQLVSVVVIQASRGDGGACIDLQRTIVSGEETGVDMTMSQRKH
jgi:hypothetical protein